MAVFTLTYFLLFSLPTPWGWVEKHTKEIEACTIQYCHSKSSWTIACSEKYLNLH